MAVQQNRKTRSKVGQRRSHHALTGATLSTEAATNEVHRRHHMTADGYYRGRQIISAASDIETVE